MENATITPLPEKRQDQEIIGLHTRVREELARLGYRGFRELFPENTSVVGEVLFTDGRSYGLAPIALHLYGSKEQPAEFLYLSPPRNFGDRDHPSYARELPLDKDADLADLRETDQPERL